jgi:hypothetical protein
LFSSIIIKNPFIICSKKKEKTKKKLSEQNNKTNKAILYKFNQTIGEDVSMSELMKYKKKKIGKKNNSHFP